MKRLAAVACWWFGCSPDFSISTTNNVPCNRCRAHDVCYSDIIGDTKHARLKGWGRAGLHLIATSSLVIAIRYRFFSRWLPAPCVCCGERFGHHDHCAPF